MKGLHWSITYGMLLALTIGFWLIACLEFSMIRSYFRENSGRYRRVLQYFPGILAAGGDEFSIHAGALCT